MRSIMKSVFMAPNNKPKSSNALGACGKLPPSFIGFFLKDLCLRSFIYGGGTLVGIDMGSRGRQWRIWQWCWFTICLFIVVGWRVVSRRKYRQSLKIEEDREANFC
uniref:Transmembrane protein n=1 Tax=Opuntia streptacantha TaxID=393608 RepID=A0A7C9CY93_OPUST